MNPRAKGWLKEYLVLRQALFLALRNNSHTASHPDFALYKALQPTGLMYGQPVATLESDEASKWSARDRLKVLLAEGLVNSALLADSDRATPSAIPDVLNNTLDRINNYYQHVFPEMAASTRTFFGRKKSSSELAEDIFERRVATLDLKGPFWVRFFHSSLLFLDVFIFGQWMHTPEDKLVSDFFHYEREELRTAVVRVMAAAAHANQTVEFEERKLLEYFLQSIHLTPERKKECRDIFERGIAVEDLNLPTGNSWLLKKYFLEMAILTFWADKRVEELEMELLHRLAASLSLQRDDVENSLLAVEGFVLEHWKALDSLQDKKSYEEVSVQFIQRMATIAAKHRNKLIADGRSNEELVGLLKRARTTELDAAEKHRLLARLVELLRQIPVLSMISLPEHFLTLPIVMQIFPKNFIPDMLEGLG